MPCARKRVHERRVVQIDDIAFRMGYLCKRVLAFDLCAMNQARCDARRLMNSRRSRSPEEKRRTNDTTHWSQTANTLAGELTQLREAKSKRDREYEALLECNSRILVSYRNMERKLVDAEREINYLKTDPFQESLVYNSIISTIPLNTEGKDALYWHQTCRTIQAQYIEAKHAVDQKTNQFIVLSKRIRELESLLRGK
jgi:hypothetical protein